MSVGTHIAEGKIFAGDPVGGRLLGSGIDIIVVHCSQFFTVHAQIDHVGAVDRELIGQAVDMLFRSVNAIISRTDAVVLMGGTVPIADGNKFTVLVTEQERRIGDSPGSGSSQHHGAAAEAAGGFPLHDPRLVMLQNHGTAQAVNCLIHSTVVDTAMEQTCFVKDIAAIRDGPEFIIIQLPAIIIRPGGAHGRIVTIIFKIADTVMVGIGSRLAAVRTEVELSGGGTDGTVLHLKESCIGSAGNEKRQRRIVAEVAGGALQIINHHCALIDGFCRGIAGQRKKHFSVVIIKALLGKGRIISLFAIHLHIGNIQGTQLGQRNGAAGSRGIQRTGVEGSASLDQNFDLRIAGRHDLHSRHAGRRAVVNCRISAGSGQLGAANGQTNQRRTAGHKQIFLSVDRHDIQCVGVTQIREVAVAGFGIGHQGFCPAAFVNTGHSRSGVIAANLGAIDIGIVDRHTLHTVAAILVINHG